PALGLRLLSTPHCGEPLPTSPPSAPKAHEDLPNVPELARMRYQWLHLGDFLKRTSFIAIASPQRGLSLELGAVLSHVSPMALYQLPTPLLALASPERKALRSQCHTLRSRARQRQRWRVFALGQRLRRFRAHVAPTAGTANGERVRRWVRETKAGWYAVLADPQMPATSPVLDQAHHAIERPW